MMAGMATKGGLSGKFCVYRFEHKAAIAKRLRAKEWFQLALANGQDAESDAVDAEPARPGAEPDAVDAEPDAVDAELDAEPDAVDAGIAPQPHWLVRLLNFVIIKYQGDATKTEAIDKLKIHVGRVGSVLVAQPIGNQPLQLLLKGHLKP